MIPTHKDPCSEEHQEQLDCKSDSPLINDDMTPRIPLVVIDEPEAGLDEFLFIYLTDF